MSVRSVLIVMMALVFGGSAAMGVNTFLNRAPGPAGDVVPVVVAAVDLPRGDSITADAVKIKQMPKEMAPAGALSKVEDAVDRAVHIPLVKDDAVLEAKLAPKGSSRGLAALIPKGMRAY